MWWGLEGAIVDAANIRIKEFEKYQKRIYEENVRRSRRSTFVPKRLEALRPAAWEVDPGFNPYHVRAHASVISHAIAKAMKAGKYMPRRPAGFYVTKHDGSQRLISTFPLADEVVSSRLFRSLLSKNKARFSSHSYAYRDDAGVYDAIMHIQSEWRSEQRIFIAEYDFASYFDSISHDHIRASMESIGLVITSLERNLVDSFLSAPLPFMDIHSQDFCASRKRGVPQGTSASLLLANLAASPLDKSLERLAVGFARYADDTLIWSRDYGSICRAVDELHAAATSIGAKVNQEKSFGVRLLVSPETKRAEIPFTSSVKFLSHRLSLQNVAIDSEVISEIKNHISMLLYNHLLREPLNSSQALSRMTHVDRDYVAYVWQLRRYLYGKLTENEIRRLGQGPIPPLTLEGILARFPLVNDFEEIVLLDAWIATQTWLALRKRTNLMAPSLNGLALPVPWGLGREHLIDFTTRSMTTGEVVDLRMPSALRMMHVVRRAVTAHGTRLVGRGSRLSVYSR